MHSLHNTLISLALGSALVACTSGGSIDGNPNNPTNPNATVVSGEVAQDVTYSGAVEIAADTTIKPGVTVSFEPGASIEGAAGVFLKVQGTLNINGTAEKPISVTALGSMSFGGIAVEAGGTANIKFATGEGISNLMYCKKDALACNLDNVEFSKLGIALRAEGPATVSNSRLTQMSGGGVNILSGATVSITNSYVNTAGGDLVVVSGGSLTVDHAFVGETSTASYDHCGFHINSADSIIITNSILASSVVGMMIGGTNGAKITNNNIMQNTQVDIDPIGTNTNVDMRQNYWDKGAPQNLGPAYDVSGAVLTPYADAGPNFAK